MHNRSTTLIQSLDTLLTPERLAPYKAAVGGDIDRALDLYEWNGRISAAVFEDLSYLEVVLRNACHNQLHEWSHRQSGNSPWYSHSVFSQASQDDIGKARQRATRSGRPERPGRVVAELMFGFWRFLHARSYEATLWTPCLRLAYPHLQPRRRQTVYTRLDHLNTLRNRIPTTNPFTDHRSPIPGRTLPAYTANCSRYSNGLIRLLQTGFARVAAYPHYSVHAPADIQQEGNGKSSEVRHLINSSVSVPVRRPCRRASRQWDASMCRGDSSDGESNREACSIHQAGFVDTST